MTPFMSLLLPIIVAAIAVFVLSSIIHMMMPWHKSDYSPFPDEDGVMDALRPFAIPPGDYMAPAPRSIDDMKSPDFMAKRTRGPVLIATVMKNGGFTMGPTMAVWFLFSLVISVIVGCITGSILGPGADGRSVFHYSAAITFMSYCMGAVPLSIWYQRKWSTTFKNALDSLIYAAGTGAVFMLMWPKG
jgi:hypothetical protein